MIKKESKSKNKSSIHEKIAKSKRSISKRNLLIFIGLFALILISATWLFAHRAQKDTNIDSKQGEVVVTKNDIANLEKATSKNGSSQDYAALGGAYSDNDQNDKAIVAYKKSLEISPKNNSQALSGLVISYAQSGQTKQAIDALNELILLAQKGVNGLNQADIQKYKVQIDRLNQGLDI